MSKATDNIKVTRASQTALTMASKYNLRLTSGYRSPAKDKAVGGSGRGDHTRGQAYDFAGSFANMEKFADWAHKSGMYKQVIFKNKDYRTGRYIGGHMDHVHIAWAGGDSGNTGGSYTPVEKEKGYVENGDKGGLVETIQKLVGTTVDGLFGNNTEQAVKDFQEKHNLTVDGLVGKETWESLTKGGFSFFLR